MDRTLPVRRLSRMERIGVGVFLVVLVSFGGLVVYRTACLSRPMGDLGVFLRAAWVVTQDGDLYRFTDDNHWHYLYPPFLAIMLQPLANPPREADLSGFVPFAVSAAIWYVFNLLLLFWGVHSLASALEQQCGDPSILRQPRGCWRWWALRLGPILVCLPAIGHSLMRGQVNLILLALVCGMIGGMLRGRALWAGLCLGGAICIKVIPAFLLLYPLWRRDGRCLAGCALSLVIGLGVIPLSVLGPERTGQVYGDFCSFLIMNGGKDDARFWELATTDNQGFQAILHNTMYLDRATRPLEHASLAVWSSRVVGAVLTLVTLAAAGRRRPLPAAKLVLFPAALLMLLIVFSPVAHLHYSSLAVPLVMALFMHQWDGGAQKLTWSFRLLGLVFIVANALPHFPGLEILRDLGVAMHASLLLWLIAVWNLRSPVPEREPVSALRLAA